MNKLNQLFKHSKSGMILTLPWLAALGISYKLAWKYTKSKWLERVGEKAYKKINDKISIERKEKKNDFVVDSIRNPGEINELKKNKDFLLLGIDAPVELRYARAEKRGRLGEAKTLQHFIKLEERENFNSKANQQLDRCLKMADKVVVNDSTLEEFHKKIDAALAKLKG